MFMANVVALDEVYSEDGFSIFCGNARSAASPKLLQDHNIRSVLNVSEQIRFRRVPEGTQKILYYYYPLSDYGDTLLSEVMEECFLPLDEARQHKFNILVHCQGGVNRSPTIVIAYLMTRLRWSLKKAFDYVHERRPVMSPHELYIKQLITLEELLFHNTTMSFEEYSQTSLQAQLRNIRAQLEKTELQQENIDTNKQEPIEGPDELCIRSKDNTDICVN